MAFNDDAVEVISAWSDILSMAILMLCLVAGGLNPSRKVWGRPCPRVLAQVLTFSLGVLWSGFRFIVEGVFKMPGPREFLVGTVIYLGRWVWLWWRMTNSTSKQSRLFKVALALKNLNTLRIGFSNDKSKPSDGTKDWEAVLRYGVPNRPPGKSYWRGVVTHERFPPDVKTWEVYLAERKLHAGMLDNFGSIEYLQGDQRSLNSAYQTVYGVVMSAVAYRQLGEKEEPNAEVPGDGHFVLPPPQPVRNVLQQGGSSRATAPSQIVNGTAEVNFGPFFEDWDALPIESVARMVGAEDLRPIGWVARRVAADAIVYINNAGKEFRADRQVKAINDCLKRTMRAHFRYDTPGDTVVDLDASSLKRS